jgi:hypothetical protein
MLKEVGLLLLRVAVSAGLFCCLLLPSLIQPIYFLLLSQKEKSHFAGMASLASASFCSLDMYMLAYVVAAKLDKSGIFLCGNAQAFLIRHG